MFVQRLQSAVMDLKSSRSPSFLDIDESIIQRNLKINNEEDEFQHLLDTAISSRNASSQLPYKTVKPKPGFCVKTKNVLNFQKIFLNICRTDIIPKPVEITESELASILESDEPSTFRIPMSLGEAHEEVDKSGHPCTVYDIAINQEFFTTVEGSILFQTFLITAAMEGLEDKYNMELDKNGWVVLKNRKSFGDIRSHRIEQRHEKPAVQEIPKQLLPKAKPLIEEVSTVRTGKPNDSASAFALARTKNGIQIIFAKIKLDNSVNSVSVSVAEKCITVSNSNQQQIFSASLPYNIKFREAKAIFNIENHVLTALLPIA